MEMAELSAEGRLALAVRAQVAVIRAERAEERGGRLAWEALRYEAIDEMRALAAAWGADGGTLLEWVGVDREAYMRAVEEALREGP
jgi:hypothetical protein